MKRNTKIISILLTFIMVASVSFAFAEDLPGAVENANDQQVVQNDADDAVTTDGEGGANYKVEAALGHELKITYVVADNPEIAPDTYTATVNENDPYTVESPKVPGYTPDKATVTGTMGTEDVEETVTYTKVSLTGLAAHPGYRAVILTFNKVDGATKYEILRTNDNKTFTTTGTSYRDGGASVLNRVYTYKVSAVFSDGSKSDPVSVSAKCVRPMWERVTFKKATTLTSHDKYHKKIRFRKGQTVTSTAYGGGKFKFYYNGYYFYANYPRMKNCKGDYIANPSGAVKKETAAWRNRTQYYDKITAEDFVNKSGATSRTSRLIWVSTYTQHMYVFKGRKGNWKLEKHWEVSTGKASTPTPTGFGKKIHKKLRRHSGIGYWSAFQSMNAIHGKRSYYKIGAPGSHGCVRNFDYNGKWVYNNCGKGTGVIIW